jgi:hypothetical protein
MKAKKCKDALKAERIDNQELRRKLATAEYSLSLYLKDNASMADEAIAYKKRALKAERMVERMIPAGNILLNQDDTENSIVELAEICWRAAVAEWRAR